MLTIWTRLNESADFPAALPHSSWPQTCVFSGDHSFHEYCTQRSRFQSARSSRHARPARRAHLVLVDMGDTRDRLDPRGRDEPMFRSLLTRNVFELHVVLVLPDHRVPGYDSGRTKLGFEDPVTRR